ncbi:hypothetical protein B0H16DRAFT_806355 [Mycena metata]|uniref:Uncharacterized protein n=1 Tax=Mycena metata TaxID=1033252 RepID=A0AAD7NWU8_9AGAR|nr:hypothetical protein B0H16DRAFT_806355 [Mycena metata]
MMKSRSGEGSARSLPPTPRTLRRRMARRRMGSPLRRRPNPPPRQQAPSLHPRPPASSPLARQAASSPPVARHPRSLHPRPAPTPPPQAALPSVRPSQRSPRRRLRPKSFSPYSSAHIHRPLISSKSPEELSVRPLAPYPRTRLGATWSGGGIHGMG